MQYRYIGCFFEKAALETACAPLVRNVLFREIACPHVTFMYKPESVDTSLFGQRIAVTAVGYGNDGKNEGLLVRLRAKDAQLQAMADAIAVPHITLSVAADAQTVDTGKLTFLPIAPFELEGVFGGYTEQFGADTGKREE